MRRAWTRGRPCGRSSTDVAAGSLAPPPMTTARRVARPVTPFVGREHDRAELLRLLDLDGSAPVTVVGPGGVGKTRLSLEVLADISDRGANRGADRREAEVVVVPLATVVDAAGLPGAVAAALGLVIAPGATSARKLDAPAADPSIDAVAAALAGRRLLLLLDNCEHLIDRCRDAGRCAIGAAAPGVQVLATSRVSLHVTGRVRDAAAAAPAATGRSRRRDLRSPAECRRIRRARAAARRGSID